MESLPQTENADTGARGISEILAKANRADLPAMRTSLSFLTSAGAQLATALQRRNQEYDEALAALSMLPPEWVQAARSGQALPDLRLLRSELEQAKEQSAHFEAQLTERGQLVQALQAQLETAAAAKSQTEAELANLEEQMNALSVELQQVVADDETAAPAAGDEAADTDTRAIETSGDESGSGGKRVALAAAAAAVAAQSHRKHEELNALNAQVADLQSLVDALSSDKQALEALLADMQVQVDAATAELDDTDQQLSGLQSDLQASLGEGVPAPELVAVADAAVPAEAEVAAPAEAVASADAQVAPADVAPQAAPETEAAASAAAPDAPVDEEPQAAPAEVVAAAPETEAIAEQVDTPQVRRAATRIALASAISAAIARNRDQQTALVESKVQLADLQVQFDAASSAQAENEAELNDLENQLDVLNDQLQPLLVDEPAPVVVAAAPAEDADAATPADEAETLEPSPDKPSLPRRAVKSAAAAATMAASELEKQVYAFNSKLLSTPADETAPAEAAAAELDAELDAEPQEEAAVQLADAQPADAQLADAQPADAAVMSELAPVETPQTRRTAKRAALAASIAAVMARVNKKQEALEASQAQLADFQAQLDAATTAKADTEAKLAGVEEQLDALTTELQPPASVTAGATMVAEEAAVGEAPVEAATGEGTPAEGEVAAAAVVAATPEGPEAKAAALVAAVAALGAKERAANKELAEAQAQLAELQAQLQARDAELAELQGRMRASEPIQDAMSVSASLAGLPQFKTRAAGAALIVGVQPYLSPKVQGLSQVIGIGSVRQQRLYNAGVGSFWELASLSNEELLQMLQLSDLRAQEVYYDGIRAEGTRLARETDSVGCIWDGDHIDDFEPLTGVGKIYEQRMYEAGICTYEKLVETSIAELTEIIHAPQMQTPDFSLWIAEARKLMEERAETKPE